MKEKFNSEKVLPSIERREITTESKEKLPEKTIVELGCGVSIGVGEIPLPERIAMYKTGYRTLHGKREYNFFNNLFFEDLKKGRARYIGVDKSGMSNIHEIEHHLSDAEREHLPQDWKERIQFVQGDVYKLPFKENAADIAIIREAQFSPMDAKQEIYRILKPGSELIIEASDSPTMTPPGRYYEELLDLFEFEGRMFEPEKEFEIMEIDGKKKYIKRQPNGRIEIVGDSVYNYYIFKKKNEAKE